MNAGTCVSTRKIYKLIDNEVKHAPYDYDDYVGNRTNNDFLSVVLSLFPEIRTMYDHLMKIAPIKLTGTGGTFYFTCESEIDAKNLIKRIQENITYGCKVLSLIDQRNYLVLFSYVIILYV